MTTKPRHPFGRDNTAPDRPFFVVMADYGKLGLEAIVSPDMTRTDVVNTILSGEFAKIAYVHEYNPAEGHARDITEDLAREIFDALSHEPFPAHVADFIEAHTPDSIALAVRRAA